MTWITLLSSNFIMHCFMKINTCLTTLIIVKVTNYQLFVYRIQIWCNGLVFLSILIVFYINANIKYYVTVGQYSQMLYFSYRGVSSMPSSGETFVFTTKTAQIGPIGYDASTGKFTTPVAGLYLFIVNACTHYKEYTQLQIVQDNKVLVASSNYDGTYANQCFSFQAFADLTSGQQVWVKCAGSCYFTHTDSYQWMQFSGALVHKAYK